MKKKKKKPVILIYILVLIILYITIYVFPKISGALEPTYNITYGELRLSDTTTGYVVRKEKLYVTDHGGNTNYYIEEGDLLRKGSTVMAVEGDTDGEISSRYEGVLESIGSKAVKTDTYTVKSGGVVYYYADGLEGKLTPKTMLKKKKDFFEQLSQKNVVALNRETVNKGEPVFKIVDRTSWYLVCYIPKDHMDRYEEGKTISVELDDITLKTTVYAMKEEGDLCKIILTTDNFYGKFGELRVIDNVQLVTYDERGLLVENKSIVKEKGQEGVYVQDKVGNVSFVPVQVIKTDGERSLVSDTRYYDEKGKEHSTVEIYDVVLRNPKQ